MPNRSPFLVQRRKYATTTINAGLYLLNFLAEASDLLAFLKDLVGVALASGAFVKCNQGQQREDAGGRMTRLHGAVGASGVVGDSG